MSEIVVSELSEYLVRAPLWSVLIRRLYASEGKEATQTLSSFIQSLHYQGSTMKIEKGFQKVRSFHLAPTSPCSHHLTLNHNSHCLYFLQTIVLFENM